MAIQSGASIIFDCSDTVFTGLNPTHNMYICSSFFCVCGVLHRQRCCNRPKYSTCSNIKYLKDSQLQNLILYCNRAQDTNHKPHNWHSVVTNHMTSKSYVQHCPITNHNCSLRHATLNYCTSYFIMIHCTIMSKAHKLWKKTKKLFASC